MAPCQENLFSRLFKGLIELIKLNCFVLKRGAICLLLCKVSRATFVIIISFWRKISQFLHFSGGILDCTAYGVPPPKVTWLRLDPEALEKAPIELNSNYASDALWQILAHNNSLKFRPFAAREYQVGIHRAAYICRASSESGTILSRIVNVKAGKAHDTVSYGFAAVIFSVCCWCTSQVMRDSALRELLSFLVDQSEKTLEIKTN